MIVAARFTPQEIKADEQSNALQKELEENEGELRNYSLIINALKRERLVVCVPKVSTAYVLLNRGTS